MTNHAKKDRKGSQHISAPLKMTYLGESVIFSLGLPEQKCKKLSDAENPPGGGFSADKTDSLVWREVQIAKYESSGFSSDDSSVPLLLSI